MKALVYTGPGTLKVLERRKPTVQRPTDAHVRLIHISICGTDLHILKGNVPCAKPGLILGHEGVGIVDSIGSAGQGLQVGDRVLISCMTSCGACQYCQSGISARCRTGGWALANTVDGTQAEYVRIPYTICRFIRFLLLSIPAQPLHSPMPLPLALNVVYSVQYSIWRIRGHYRSGSCGHGSTSDSASLYTLAHCHG